MQRPSCVKCSSTFVRLQEELDGYYSHCKCCGLLTLLQSKYEDVLPKDVDLAGLDPDEKVIKPKTFNYKYTKPSVSYYAVIALQSGPKTSGDIARFIHSRLTTSTWISISGNVGATLSMLAKDHKAVEIVEYRKGARGGSTWALGEGAGAYLSMYRIVEEKAVVEAILKAEQRKPTLMEMLAGQRVKNPSQRLSALYG